VLLTLHPAGSPAPSPRRWQAEPVDYREHVATVERETASIVAAVHGAPRGARVPTCPDFSLADLVGHVGEFTALWTHVLCEATGAENSPYAPLEEDDDLATWYRPLADHLLERLRATSGDTYCWMWMDDQQTATGVARRCANELSIHRYDVQTASTAPTPLDPATALDAIEEIFVMLPAWDNPPVGSGQTLLLRATDGARRRISLEPGGPKISDEGGLAALTLTGSASDLALVLFERPTLGTVQTDGDPAALDAWYREFRFD
jgi:uncharacterized protein (TIGR03083 family)